MTIKFSKLNGNIDFTSNLHIMKKFQLFEKINYYFEIVFYNRAEMLPV